MSIYLRQGMKATFLVLGPIQSPVVEERSIYLFFHVAIPANQRQVERWLLWEGCQAHPKHWAPFLDECNHDTILSKTRGLNHANAYSKWSLSSFRRTTGVCFIDNVACLIALVKDRSDNEELNTIAQSIHRLPFTLEGLGFRV